MDSTTATTIRAALADALRALPDDQLRELLQHVTDDALIAAAWKAAEAQGLEEKRAAPPRRAARPQPPRANAPARSGASKTNGAAPTNGSSYIPRSPLGKQVLSVIQLAPPTGMSAREIMNSLETEATMGAISVHLTRLRQKKVIRPIGHGPKTRWAI